MQTVLPQEAIEEAIGEVREVMRQYTACADPTESAARKERLRQAEEQVEVEEAAIQMVQANLENLLLMRVSRKSVANMRLSKSVAEQSLIND